MRYSDRSGGLSGTERERREALRLRAADMFSGGITAPRVAHLLGVTRKSACEWHRAWLKGGKTALTSKGAAGTGCKLTETQLMRLEEFLDEGARAHGWNDQRWTTSRITVLIAEKFHVRYTPRGVAYLLERLGWSFQVPAHRAARRDDEEIATWVKQVWTAIKAPGRPGVRGSSLPTSPART
jgi:transposase